MIGYLSLKQLTLDVWLLEQLRHEPDPGLTLEELQKRWTANPLHEGTVYLQFHISPSPDFISELLKWGNEIVIL